MNTRFRYVVLILSVAAVVAVSWKFWRSLDADFTENGGYERVEFDTETEQASTPGFETKQLEAVPAREATERDKLPEEISGRVDLKLEDAEPLELREDHSHTLGRWLGTLSPSPSEWPSSEKVLGVSFQTPDGEDLEFVMDRSESFGPNKGLRAGHVEGKAFSEVIVSYVNDSVAGVIRFPAESIAWELRNKGEGVVEFEKVDLKELKGCVRCAEKH